MTTVISPTIQNQIFVVLLEVIELDDDKCESRISLKWLILLVLLLLIIIINHTRVDLSGIWQVKLEWWTICSFYSGLCVVLMEQLHAWLTETAGMATLSRGVRISEYQYKGIAFLECVCACAGRTAYACVCLHWVCGLTAKKPQQYLTWQFWLLSVQLSPCGSLFCDIIGYMYKWKPGGYPLSARQHGSITIVIIFKTNFKMAINLKRKNTNCFSL